MLVIVAVVVVLVADVVGEMLELDPLVLLAIVLVVVGIMLSLI